MKNATHKFSINNFGNENLDENLQGSIGRNTIYEKKRSKIFNDDKKFPLQERKFYRKL